VIEYYHLELDARRGDRRSAAAETYGTTTTARNSSISPAAGGAAKLPCAVLTTSIRCCGGSGRNCRRAGRLDPTLMLGADLHLLAAGVRLDPESIERGLWRFRLAGRSPTCASLAQRGAVGHRQRWTIAARRWPAAHRLAQPASGTLQWDDVRLVVGSTPRNRPGGSAGRRKRPPAGGVLLRLRAGPPSSCW